MVGDQGRAQYRSKLLAKILEKAGRSDVAVGIGLDVNSQGEGGQAAWVKDYDLKKYPGKVYEDGVQAIVDTIMKSQKKITLICIGPVPNIKAALEKEPKIAEKANFVGIARQCPVRVRRQQGNLSGMECQSRSKSLSESFYRTMGYDHHSTRYLRPYHAKG